MQAHQRYHRRSLIGLVALVGVVFGMTLISRSARVQASLLPLAPASTNYGSIAYPHVMLYTGVNSNGWPIVGSVTPSGTCSNNTNLACEFDSDCGGNSCQNRTNTAPAIGTPINQTVLQQYASFPMITLPPTPVVDLRQDLVPALRAANPNIKIFAYVMPSTSWCPIGGYAPGVYYGDVRETAASFDSSNQPYRSSCLTNGDGFVHMQGGGISSDAPYNLVMNINLAKRVLQPDNSYTYPVADAMADLIFQKVYQSGKYDGIFQDVFCNRVVWMEHGSTKFDYKANGYGTDNTIAANRTAFDDGWNAGYLEYSTRLRNLISATGNTSFPITGNCGLSDPGVMTTMNGWMRENFPQQGGGSWYSNMYNTTVGYLINNQSFRAPQINYLFGAESNWWDPYSLSNARGARFTLASASLGEGYGSFQEASVSVYTTPMWQRWYDEYGVDLVTGTTSNHTNSGWLGQPRTTAYQMIWANTNPDLVSNSGFESNTTGWSMSSFSPAVATMTRETSGAAVGGADVRATVTSPSETGWHASFGSTTTFSITQGVEYSVTFWAKADHARSVEVILDKPGGGGYAGQIQPLTTEWKQYQVRLVPNTSTTGVNVRFDMANEVGDVWYDDVHVQLGVTSIYRRDFDHGIVLVNPSNYPMTVALEKPFKKIHGTIAPSVNDGSIVSSVTLAGASSQNGVGDALFLLDIDITPPGQVLDLQAQ